MEGPLLSPKQVAAMLGTTNKTILEWFHQGIIPAEIAEGKIYRFDLEKVLAALAARVNRKGVRNSSTDRLV